LNYQEKVSTRQDVRVLFEKVKANPAVARYRGYTETKSYGWDEAADDYVKCEGEVWFDNPAYDPDFVTVGTANEESRELLDEQLLARDEAIATLSLECDTLRLKVEELTGALAVAEEERESAVAKKDTVCAILCNLRAVLEAVLAYKAE
jgi:hypothetical protein